MDFKLVNEKPYDECTREELIEGMEIKDHNFQILGEEYLRIKEGINNLVQSMTNESIQTAQLLQTEIALTKAGVPSENNDEIQVKIGRMQVYKMVMEHFLSLEQNDKNVNNGN